MLKSLKTTLDRFKNETTKLFSNPQFVIDFVKQHFFYLIWILIVPITLYKMAQGRELFTGLFDDHTVFTAIRGGGLLWVYFLQAMAVFLLPLPFYRKNTYEDWERLRPATLNDPGVQYILSVIPALLYGLIMIAIQADHIPGWGWPLIVLMLAGTAFTAFWFEDKWSYGLKPTLFLIVGNMVLCTMSLLFIPETVNRFWNYFIVGGCLMIQMALLGGLTRKLHHEFRRLYDQPVFESASALASRRKLGIYDWIYLSMFASLTGFVVLCVVASNVEGFSPIFMLLMTTTFYLLASSLFIAFYRFNIQRHASWRSWVFLGLLLIFSAVVFRFGAPIHDVKTVTATNTPEQRASFNQWFEVWSKANLLPDTTRGGEIPVYLVAIQGGGSRAGIWASSLLNELEIKSNYRFHNHCLAISSASGGSAGTGATLAFWRYASDSSAFMQQLGRTRKDSLYRGFAAGMFQRNYLSSSFYDLLIGEVGTSFLYFSKFKQDRNYRHQKDEALGFAAGLRNGIYGVPSTSIGNIRERIRALWYRGDRAMLPVHQQRKVHNYPFDPYLSYWYDTAGRPKPQFPLYFPITTHIQKGKSGYSSPVKMDPYLFTDAIDMLAAVKKSGGKDTTRTLSMVGATNFSQLFPVMNAFTFIPGTGNFADGGLFENMGLTAMLALYHRTNSLIQTLPHLQRYKDRIRIHFIIITNNALEEHKFKPDLQSVKRAWQPTSLLSFMGGASINGTSTYYTKKTAQELKDKDVLHELWLQAPDTIMHKIPLGRWLAKKTLRATQERIKDCTGEIEAIVKPLNGGG